jgi:hypothetical protein
MALIIDKTLCITVVQSLHTPTETQEPSSGAQQGGWEEKIFVSYQKIILQCFRKILSSFAFSINFFIIIKIEK